MALAPRPDPYPTVGGFAWGLGVAVNATPPDPAGSPATRVGMPELAPTLAAGPEIRYRLRGRPWGFFTTTGVHSRYRRAVGGGFSCAHRGRGPVYRMAKPPPFALADDTGYGAGVAHGR